MGGWRAGTKEGNGLLAMSKKKKRNNKSRKPGPGPGRHSAPLEKSDMDLQHYSHALEKISEKFKEALEAIETH